MQLLFFIYDIFELWVPYKVCLQIASYSGGHKQAQYDHQIYRELQGKARLQAKSFRTTSEFTRVTVINKINIRYILQTAPQKL